MTYDFKSVMKESKYDKLPVDEGKNISLKSFIKHVREITLKDTKNQDALIVLALFCCLQPEGPKKDDGNETDQTESNPFRRDSLYSVKSIEEEKK